MNATPTIPEGLATKLGKYGAAATILLALIVELANVNLSEDTEKLALGALSLVLTTIAGRMAQGYAQHRDAPSPAQLDDFSGVYDDETDERVANDTDLLPEGAVGGKPGLA